MTATLNPVAKKPDPCPLLGTPAQAQGTQTRSGHLYLYPFSHVCALIVVMLMKSTHPSREAEANFKRASIRLIEREAFSTSWTYTPLRNASVDETSR